MKTPIWFTGWYYKYLIYIWPAITLEETCYRAYLKGKRDGLALAEERYYEATRTDHDVNP